MSLARRSSSAAATSAAACRVRSSSFSGHIAAVGMAALAPRAGRRASSDLFTRSLSIWRRCQSISRVQSSWDRSASSLHRHDCSWVRGSGDPRITPRDPGCDQCQREEHGPEALSSREVVWQKHAEFWRDFLERDPYDAIFGRSNALLKGRFPAMPTKSAEHIAGKEERRQIKPNLEAEPNPTTEASNKDTYISGYSSWTYRETDANGNTVKAKSGATVYDPISMRMVPVEPEDPEPLSDRDNADTLGAKSTDAMSPAPSTKTKRRLEQSWRKERTWQDDEAPLDDTGSIPTKATAHFRQAQPGLVPTTRDTYKLLHRRTPLKSMTAWELGQHRETLLKRWSARRYTPAPDTAADKILKAEVEQVKRSMAAYEAKAAVSKASPASSASLGGEGDVCPNAANFVTSPRWYKNKAPHVSRNADTDHDKVLVGEIRTIYEEAYGPITDTHTQAKRAKISHPAMIAGPLIDPSRESLITAIDHHRIKNLLESLSAQNGERRVMTTSQMHLVQLLESEVHKQQIRATSLENQLKSRAKGDAALTAMRRQLRDYGERIDKLKADNLRQDNKFRGMIAQQDDLNRNWRKWVVALQSQVRSLGFDPETKPIVNAGEDPPDPKASWPVALLPGSNSVTTKHDSAKPPKTQIGNFASPTGFYQDTVEEGVPVKSAEATKASSHKHKDRSGRRVHKQEPVFSGVKTGQTWQHSADSCNGGHRNRGSGRKRRWRHSFLHTLTSATIVGAFCYVTGVTIEKMRTTGGADDCANPPQAGDFGHSRADQAMPGGKQLALVNMLMANMIEQFCYAGHNSLDFKTLSDTLDRVMDASYGLYNEFRDDAEFNSPTTRPLVPNLWQIWEDEGIDSAMAWLDEHMNEELSKDTLSFDKPGMYGIDAAMESLPPTSLPSTRALDGMPFAIPAEGETWTPRRNPDQEMELGESLNQYALRDIARLDQLMDEFMDHSQDQTTNSTAGLDEFETPRLAERAESERERLENRTDHSQLRKAAEARQEPAALPVKYQVQQSRAKSQRDRWLKEASGGNSPPRRVATLAAAGPTSPEVSDKSFPVGLLLVASASLWAAASLLGKRDW